MLLNLGVGGCALADRSPLLGRPGRWASVLMFGALCNTLAAVYFHSAGSPALMVGAGVSGTLMALWLMLTAVSAVSSKYGRGQPT